MRIFIKILCTALVVYLIIGIAIYASLRVKRIIIHYCSYESDESRIKKIYAHDVGVGDYKNQYYKTTYVLLLPFATVEKLYWNVCYKPGSTFPYAVK